MPFVTVQIAKGHSIEKKRQLAQAITDALFAICCYPDDEAKYGWCNY
ncbi:hypothetical protein CEN50_08190 [Fischerella thermalis CCMEE 5268]|uniref:4-oxalocrotonate tautomerase-like domain-containing protein n=1 Tax=Fischerella thermalis CCMEE 5268 TaxID=2019662 RepID=A0A2N6KIA2_9CYAN|nr:hypothetical protein CEN50_08190 [Fischerella thermalis CCMEE 5268]